MRAFPGELRGDKIVQVSKRGSTHPVAISELYEILYLTATLLGKIALMPTSQVKQDPLLDRLNDRQREAVLAGDESCIVLAGAGSGKTSVLTSRAAYLIREGRARDEDLLLVTFTNKAAAEMKERLGRLLGRSPSAVWVGTFHSISNRMLRENHIEAGLPVSFTIMDDDDQLAMCKRILSEIHDLPEDIDAKSLKGFINRNKEKGLRASQVSDSGGMYEFEIRFYEMYEARCAREGVVDFAELLLRVSELLETNQRFLDDFRGRFSHIQVDEFQDTNAIQYKWLLALKGPQTSIFAVGDDDQSIYAFRGSDPQNMQAFVRDVAQDRVIRLEQNYRSTGAILDAANSLIEKNTDRLGKNLWTDAGAGSQLNILSFRNDLDESDHVARSIKKLIDSGTDPSEIAILYRSNYQSYGYEKALMAHGVPYVIYGGTKFYERMEIKNALAYMRLVIRYADDGAFMRIINLPSRGIGEKTLEQVAQIARRSEESPGVPMSLVQATTLLSATPKLTEKFRDFLLLLSDLHQKMVTLPLPQYVEYLVAATGLEAFYKEKTEEKDRDRSNNLAELVSAAARFCEESDRPNALSAVAYEILPEFLGVAMLESAADKVANEAEDGLPAPAVNMMSVHASKGLEFDTVFIGGADDGIFPLGRSVDLDGDEEERRLMYVAITRGKKRVSLTTRDEARIYGERRELVPSRFISEISPEYRNHQRPKSGAPKPKY